MKDNHTEGKTWPEMVVQLPFMSHFHFESDYMYILLILDIFFIAIAKLKMKMIRLILNLCLDYTLVFTLDSGINIGVRLLIYGFFSRGYILIKEGNA